MKTPARPLTDTAPGRTTAIRNPIDDGLYRNVWRHAAGARVMLVASMLLLIASQLVKLVVPWCAAQAVDALQHGGAGSFGHALAAIGGALGACVVSWTLHGPGRVLERHVGVRVRTSLSDALYARLAAAPLGWHERHHSSDMQQRARQSTGALYNFAQNQFVYLHSVVNFFGPIMALTLLSGPLGLFALAGYALMAAASRRFDRSLMRLSKQETDADRQYNASLSEFLGHMRTILSLRLQGATRGLLARRLQRVFEPLGRSILLTEYKWCMVDLLSATLTWALVIGYVLVASHGAAAAGTGLALGAVFMVHQYGKQAADVASAMAGQLQGLAQARTDFASAAPIFEAPQSPPPQALPADWQSLAISNLAFRHPGAGAGAPSIALAGLTLRRGERIALVGGSGSGKSTLMRVLAGLYPASEARIEIDGEVRPGLRDIASLATLIPQEADVFEGSLRENLDFGLDAPAAAIERALRGSAFDTVMAGLPLGFTHPIAQAGSNFSGGQRQRLCMARGALAAADSSVVFLDEPTSALDPITEEQIHLRLARTFPGACIVASVHRMSLLHHFDRVVMMSDGAIVDAGTAAELQARQPAFAAMLRSGRDAAALPERATGTAHVDGEAVAA